MFSQRDRILAPYTRRVRDFRHLATRTGVFVLVILFSMFMGFWLAVFGTLVMQPFLAVIGVLLIGALWVVDDTDVDLRPQATRMFLTYIAMLAIWPAYLAVDVPGLPWITPVRLALMVLILTIVLQMAQSARARAELFGTLTAVRPGLIWYCIFWFFALGTFVFASKPGDALAYSFNFLILWNMPFLAAAWLMNDEKLLPRLVRTLMWCLTGVFFLTVLEYNNRAPIWFGHIPSFLKIDGPMFDALMSEQSRVGDDRYRARGVFGVHLYYAQFVLMMLPFAIHAAFTETARRQAASIALVLFALVVCWMTNTRTALLGFAVVSSGSIALFGLRRFLNPTGSADMVAPAMFMAAPAAILAFVGMVAASPRLQNMMFGGAQHAGSDDVRAGQWDKALAALAKNPIGHGGNSSGPLAGRPSNGTWIVDSTWINFLVDYGVIGAFAFAAFAATMMFYGVRIYLRSYDESANLCGPAAVSIGACLMTMYVISFIGNFAMLLIMVGAIAATKARLQKAGLVDKPRAMANPLPALVRT